MAHEYSRPEVSKWLLREKCQYWEFDPILRPEDVPETLDFSGEFGCELALFLPFVNWLSKAGWLHRHKIRTYYGMRCFYDDLDCREIAEKLGPRTSVPVPKRLSILPVKDEFAFRFCGRSAYHLFPDLRRKFHRFAIPLSTWAHQRPVLIVHNKHNFDLRRGPLNSISLETLDAVFTLMKPYFLIVYMRHGINKLPSEFSEDHNDVLPFDDRSILRRHPTVLCFDDEYESYKAHGGEYNFNLLKNVLFSRCFHYISSQGGATNHIAGFSGSLLMVLHRAGTEPRWAYYNGYFDMTSNPAPILAVCHNERELIRGLGLFLEPHVSNNRVLLSPDKTRLLEQLSPMSLSTRMSTLSIANITASSGFAAEDRKGSLHRAACSDSDVA